MKRDIERDRGICDAATPGPWVSVNKSVRVKDAPLGPFGTAPYGPLGGICNCLGQRLVNKVTKQVRANARFIAEAREALPHYIDRVESVEKQLAEVVRHRNEVEEMLDVVIDRLIVAEGCPDGCDEGGPGREISCSAPTVEMKRECWRIALEWLFQKAKNEQDLETMVKTEDGREYRVLTSVTWLSSITTPYKTVVHRDLGSNMFSYAGIMEHHASEAEAREGHETVVARVKAGECQAIESEPLNLRTIVELENGWACIVSTTRGVVLRGSDTKVYYVTEVSNNSDGRGIPWPGRYSVQYKTADKAREGHNRRVESIKKLGGIKQ